MPHLRWSLVPVVSVALVAPSQSHDLRFQVAPSTTLVRTLESGYALDLESMVLTLDGEEIPAELLGEFELHLERKEQATVTDVIEGVEDGRPVVLVRSFDALSAAEKARFSSPDGSEDQDSDFESALEGERVVFRWNTESGAFDVSFAEGGEGDAELLAELEEDMDLRRFLPEAPVGEGDTWEVDAQAYAAVLDPGGDLALENTSGEEDTSAQDAALRANLAGTIRATYRGARNEGEVRVGVIALELDVSTHAEISGPMEDEPGTTETSRVEARFELEGELLWDLQHGHALALELSGTSEFHLVQTLRGELEGEPYEQIQKMQLAGEAGSSMRFERR
jgi:hypothetical protein